MWEGLMARLRGQPKAPEPLPEPDEQLALGTLLVRVAKADNDYDAAEIGEIDHILSASFGLDPIEAAKMRAVCERMERVAPTTMECASLIRETVPLERRIDVLTGLWMVAMADGERARAEVDAVHELQAALGLSAQEADRAHARALRTLAEQS